MIHVKEQSYYFFDSLKNKIAAVGRGSGIRVEKVNEVVLKSLKS